MKDRKTVVGVVAICLVILGLCGLMFFHNDKQIDAANDYKPINYRDTSGAFSSSIESHTLEIGNTLQLDYSNISSSAINKKLVFSSSNNSVATVSSTGLVTARGVGNAIVTVSVANSSTSTYVTSSYNVMIKVINKTTNVSCPTITYDSRTSNKKMYVELENNSNISSVTWYVNKGKKYRIGADATWEKVGSSQENKNVKVAVEYKVGYARQVYFQVVYKSGEVKNCYSAPITCGISVDVSVNNDIICPSYNVVGKTADGNNVKLMYNLGNENYQYTWIPKNVVTDPFAFSKMLTSTVSGQTLINNITSTMVNIERQNNRGNLIVMDEKGSIHSCFTDYFEGKSVTSIDINNAPSQMMVGENKQLSVGYNPSNAKPVSVNWSSSNTGVLQVDNKGNVKAIATGSATITAVSTKNAALSKTITINVVKSNLSCPKITYDYSNSKKVKIKIEPTKNTTSWKWYTNQPNNYGGYGVGSYATWKDYGNNTGTKAVTLSYQKDDAVGNSKSRQGKIVIKNKQGVTKDCYTHYFTGGAKGYYTVSSGATCPTYSAKRDGNKVTVKYNLTDQGYQYSWYDGISSGSTWTKDITNASSSNYVVNVKGYTKSGTLSMMDASGNIKMCSTENFDFQISENTSKTTTINQAYGKDKTKLAVEKGVSNEEANKFIKYVKNINSSRNNSKTGVSYKMGSATEAYLLTESTFEKMWGKGYCGMAINFGSRRIVTIPANSCNNEATLSHELAHTSDFYYQSVTGVQITSGLLNGVYRNNNTLNLNRAEFWANLYMRYYGYYKNGSTSDFTSSELKTYRSKIENVLKELNNL